MDWVRQSRGVRVKPSRPIFLGPVLPGSAVGPHSAGANGWRGWRRGRPAATLGTQWECELAFILGHVGVGSWRCRASSRSGLPGSASSRERSLLAWEALQRRARVVQGQTEPLLRPLASEARDLPSSGDGEPCPKGTIRVMAVCYHCAGHSLAAATPGLESRGRFMQLCRADPETL